MSDPEQSQSWFRGRVFLVGLALGVLASAILGRVVSASSYHRDFTRFHARISPEAHYYPTLEEMRSIVRAKCRPDQVLVIVGGNSIFYGVGQPVGKIWTEELQRRLGPEYCVVNLALRGAVCTDGGAIIAESLRDEFPRQIYVANTSPFATPPPFGIEPYRYLFREAWARGLLLDFAPRAAAWKDFNRREIGPGERTEKWSLGMLDRGLRFRDLWNWVGYNWLFTIENPHTPKWPQSMWPRGRFRDEEGDFELTPTVRRFPREVREAEMLIVRGFSAAHSVRTVEGKWAVKPASREAFMVDARAAVPDILKPRTLIVLSRNSPNYLALLDADEAARDEFVYREAEEAWRAAGYRATDYGPGFTIDDFGDRTHLSASGGRKLARWLAPQIQAMSAQLGYGTKGGAP